MEGIFMLEGHGRCSLFDEEECEQADSISGSFDRDLELEDSELLRKPMNDNPDGERGDRKRSSSPRPSSGIRIGAGGRLLSFCARGKGGTGGGASQTNWSVGERLRGREERRAVGGEAGWDIEPVRRWLRR